MFKQNHLFLFHNILLRDRRVTENGCGPQGVLYMIISFKNEKYTNRVSMTLGLWEVEREFPLVQKGTASLNIQSL